MNLSRIIFCLLIVLSDCRRTTAADKLIPITGKPTENSNCIVQRATPENSVSGDVNQVMVRILHHDIDMAPTTFSIFDGRNLTFRRTAGGTYDVKYAHQPSVSLGQVTFATGEWHKVQVTAEKLSVQNLAKGSNIQEIELHQDSSHQSLARLDISVHTKNSGLDVVLSCESGCVQMQTPVADGFCRPILLRDYQDFWVWAQQDGTEVQLEFSMKNATEISTQKLNFTMNHKDHWTKFSIISAKTTNSVALHKLEGTSSTTEGSVVLQTLHEATFCIDSQSWTLWSLGCIDEDSSTEWWKIWIAVSLSLMGVSAIVIACCLYKKRRSGLNTIQTQESPVSWSDELATVAVSNTAAPRGRRMVSFYGENNIPDLDVAAQPQTPQMCQGENTTYHVDNLNATENNISDSHTVDVPVNGESNHDAGDTPLDEDRSLSHGPNTCDVPLDMVNSPGPRNGSVSSEQVNSKVTESCNIQAATNVTPKQDRPPVPTADENSDIYANLADCNSLNEQVISTQEMYNPEGNIKTESESKAEEMEETQPTKKLVHSKTETDTNESNVHQTSYDLSPEKEDAINNPKTEKVERWLRDIETDRRSRRSYRQHRDSTMRNETCKTADVRLQTEGGSEYGKRVELPVNAKGYQNLDEWSRDKGLSREPRQIRQAEQLYRDENQGLPASCLLHSPQIPRAELKVIREKKAKLNAKYDSSAKSLQRQQQQHAPSQILSPHYQRGKLAIPAQTFAHNLDPSSSPIPPSIHSLPRTNRGKRPMPSPRTTSRLTTVHHNQQNNGSLPRFLSVNQGHPIEIRSNSQINVHMCIQDNSRNLPRSVSSATSRPAYLAGSSRYREPQTARQSPRLARGTENVRAFEGTRIVYNH